jgi:hypothetical protein
MVEVECWEYFLVANSSSVENVLWLHCKCAKNVLSIMVSYRSRNEEYNSIATWSQAVLVTVQNAANVLPLNNWYGDVLKCFQALKQGERGIDYCRKQCCTLYRKFSCTALWCGVALCDVIWCYVMLCGVIWYDVVWCDMMWYDMMLCGVIWCDMIWCCVVWYDVIWYDVVWCDMIWWDMMLCGVICNMMWYDIMWCAMIRYDMMCYGVVWCKLVWFIVRRCTAMFDKMNFIVVWCSVIWFDVIVPIVLDSMSSPSI